MRILNFSVEGYKNLTQRVELRGLEPVTAIYGPNNVGKSNLLEAMGLPFALAAMVGINGGLPLGIRYGLARDQLAAAGYPLGEVLNLGRPTPITMELDLAFDDDELARVGPTATSRTLSVALQLEVRPEGPSWSITRFRLDDGADLVALGDVTGRRERAVPYALLLGGQHLEGGEWVRRSAFHHVAVHRSAKEGTRSLIHPDLMLALYDRQESSVAAERAQWTLFESLLARFDDIIGSRDVRAVYNRKASQANLLVEVNNTLVPAHLLGTGVQQLIVLCGTLATSGASVVAVEEPEANLSFGLQLRLREALRQLVPTGGLSQIFFTTHSPGFQLGPEFFVMRPGPSGPEIARAPRDLLPTLTGLNAEGSAPITGRAPQSWVTEDGLVRLPPFVVDGLKLQHGGGVVFIGNDDGTFKLMTNAQAIEALEGGEE